MTNIFKPVLDIQLWRPVSPAPAAHSAGVSLCYDMCKDNCYNPNVGLITSNTAFWTYNTVQKSWRTAGSPALAGTFGAGAGTTYAKSRALFGTIAAGATTSSVVISTAFPAAVGANSLANMGNSNGFRIRIVGSSAGGSGKTEERMIVANSLGTKPTIYVDTPFTFTPASGDTYEILGGRFFGLGAGTTAAGTWRSYESCTNFQASLSTTNLPATIGTDAAFAVLDEYMCVPSVRLHGEGFLIGTATYDNATKGCLQSTATAAGTITGQSSGGDASVVANEYRNFQIRIVEDTATPTAVGQRRIIASHTAGVSPVYTLGTNWTVTPSATAKFVIEMPNLILLRSSATAVVYTYNYSGATINNGTNSINSDAWHVTYFGNAPAVMGAGSMIAPSWGITPDTGKNARHSHLFNFRGGGSATCDLLDIAGGTTGAWTTAVGYDGAASAFTTGSCGAYSSICCGGKYFFINFYTSGALNQMLRFDVLNRTMLPFSSTGWIQSGTAAASERMATMPVLDGNDKYTVVLLLAHTSANAYECLVQAP